MRESPRDPGLDGHVPFRFACHRCGHCCSGGTGHVWLEAGEVERLAACFGATPAGFAARHVRTVVDPRTGARRDALVEAEPGGGRCTLLVGSNSCSAYDARPEHCRRFPYWDSVLTDEASFEAARATCPGIAVEVAPDVAARAFAELERVYAGIADERAPTVCCLEAEPDEARFATALEVDFALAEACPPIGGCRLGARRPLACRARGDHSAPLASIRAAERRTGYPAAYARVRDLVHGRRAAEARA